MVDEKRPALRDYLALLEQVPETFRRSWDAIAIYDLDGRIASGNRAAIDLIGETFAAELQGRRLAAHMTLEASRRAAQAFATCVTTGKTVEGESSFSDAEGNAIPVRYRLAPARLNGTIVGVIGFARDISDVRNAEQQFVRSEQQFRALFERHPDALSIHDLEGRYVRVNEAMTKLSGYSADELIGQHVGVLGGEANDDLERAIARVIAGETVEFERSPHPKSGERLDVSVLGVPLLLDGRVRGFALIMRDVTEERRRERESARAAKRIGDLYQIAAASTMSADDRISSALDRARDELHTSWAYVGHFHDGVMELTHTSGDPDVGFEVGFSTPIERTIASRIVEADDAFVIADLSKAPFRDQLIGKRAAWRSFIGYPISINGERWGSIGFLTNARAERLDSTDRDYVRAIGALITSALQQSLREKRLDTLAFHDALTGLPNRALLIDRLERALLAARRNRRSFAVHYVDIDYFKNINDTYGHHVGDGVLVAVADWLQSNVRDSDTVARIGGDEFVVLQPEIESLGQAEDLAARLVTIRDAKLHIGDDDIGTRLSVGVAIYPADGATTDDMLRAADATLYRVKNSGRDGYAIGAGSDLA